MNKKAKSPETIEWIAHPATIAARTRQTKLIEILSTKLLAVCDASTDPRVVKVVTEYREARKLLALLVEGEFENGRASGIG